MLATFINFKTSVKSVFIDMIMTTRSSFFHVTVINFIAHEKGGWANHDSKSLFLSFFRAIAFILCWNVYGKIEFIMIYCTLIRRAHLWVTGWEVDLNYRWRKVKVV
jgi:hypothetical protein